MNMPPTCPTCGGHLIYRPSYHILNGEEVPADLRCIHCGTSVIHFPHQNIEPTKPKKKGGTLRECKCGCGETFLSTRNGRKVFYDLKECQKRWKRENELGK